MKKSFLVAAAVAMVSCAGLFADNVGPGLGRIALEGKSGKGWELLGTFLNGLCYNGTFAITFGTSGYQDGARIGMADADLFIAENMDSLAKDIAIGEGEYLDTLTDILAVEDKVAFKTTLHENFSNIYTSSKVSADEVSSRIQAYL